jgi:large repetitive protein
LPGDCDDGDPDANPGREELCDGSRDDDCDGATDEEGADGCAVYHRDSDGDGWGQRNDWKCLCSPQGEYSALPSASFDCNDQLKDINPGATERCNGYDDNCNQLVDDEEDPSVCGSPGP